MLSTGLRLRLRFRRKRIDKEDSGGVGQLRGNEKVSKLKSPGTQGESIWGKEFYIRSNEICRVGTVWSL